MEKISRLICLIAFLVLMATSCMAQTEVNQTEVDHRFHHLIEKRQSCLGCVHSLIGYQCLADNRLTYDYTCGCFRCSSGSMTTEYFFNATNRCTANCITTCMTTCNGCTVGNCGAVYNSCIGANCVGYFHATANTNMNTCTNTANRCINNCYTNTCRNCTNCIIKSNDYAGRVDFCGGCRLAYDNYCGCYGCGK